MFKLSVFIILRVCFKALSIFITKLFDFKLWTNYTICDFCSETGSRMCHDNNFN